MNLLPVDKLPTPGWVGGDRVFDPAEFQPVTQVNLDWIGDLGTKPWTGGPWCAPTIRQRVSGRVLGTAWSYHPTSRKSPGAPQVTIVDPDPAATVAVITSHANLLDLVERFPDRRPLPWPASELLPALVNPHRHINAKAERIDWPAMAEQVDILYVTAAGIRACAHHPVNGPPHLWGWDVPTILFLTPAFRVAERGEVRA